jgi:hypothetical protein
LLALLQPFEAARLRQAPLLIADDFCGKGCWRHPPDGRERGVITALAKIHTDGGARLLNPAGKTTGGYAGRSFQ